MSYFETLFDELLRKVKKTRSKNLNFMKMRTSVKKCCFHVSKRDTINKVNKNEETETSIKLANVMLSSQDIKVTIRLPNLLHVTFPSYKNN